MVKRNAALLCGLLASTLLWICLAGSRSDVLSALVTTLRASRTIPGNTELKHCDDKGVLDPANDLFRMSRLFIQPNPPVVNRNVSIFVFGNFKKDISRNATTWFFLNANNGELAGWGGGGFCNHTTVVQTIDGLTGPGCPAVAGSAFLRSDLFIDEIWPAGPWDIHVDVRNSADATESEATRLFCVEGELQVQRPGGQGIFRILEAITPGFVWTWWERQGIDASL